MWYDWRYDCWIGVESSHNNIRRFHRWGRGREMKEVRDNRIKSVYKLLHEHDFQWVSEWVSEWGNYGPTSWFEFTSLRAFHCAGHERERVFMEWGELVVLRHITTIIRTEELYWCHTTRLNERQHTRPPQHMGKCISTTIAVVIHRRKHVYSAVIREINIRRVALKFHFFFSHKFADDKIDIFYSSYFTRRRWWVARLWNRNRRWPRDTYERWLFGCRCRGRRESNHICRKIAEIILNFEIVFYLIFWRVSSFAARLLNNDVRLCMHLLLWHFAKMRK